MNSLIINSFLKNQMELHALRAYPNECCGFFYGKEQTNERRLLEVRPVNNSQPGSQRRRFEISALDYMKAEKYALDSGVSLLGVYHSHPDHPAIPSRHDLDQAVPYFSYVILAVKEDQVENITSWQLVDGKFREEKIIEHKIETLN